MSAAERVFAGRPEFVSQADLHAAADAFVKAVGWGNQEQLERNLTNVVVASDVMRALRSALTANFNVYRQDQIRQENDRRLASVPPDRKGSR